MLSIFYTNKYDNKLAVITQDKSYTYLEIKNQVAWQIENIKNKKDNVVILSGDNYKFIINFFAALFCNKNIYLLTDKTRLNTLKMDFDLLDEVSGKSLENYEFPQVNQTVPFINFYTSGSSFEPKNIKKSLYNLVQEAEILGKECNIKNDDYTVLLTTSMCHLYGLVFSLIYPFYSGYKIDIRAISSPEDIDGEKTILISTPTFLNSIQKYNVSFKTPPKYIFSAGSKLGEDIFKFLEKNSIVIDIYGSTETGTVGQKFHYDSSFSIFGNVQIIPYENYAEIISEGIYGSKTIVNDKIEVKDGLFEVKHRTDRLFKVYEKRISSDELERDLKKSELVSDCYIMKHREKPVCLCALSQQGQKYLLKYGVPSLSAELKQFLRKYSEIVPQRWKYIDSIPMTLTGKINKKIIEHFFNLKLSLPIILDRTIQGDNIEYKIFFYNQCNFFKGHFPQFKLLPGVVQLYYAKEFANIHFNLTLGEGQWKKIKFSNIIEPDSIVHLKLEKSKKYVSYEYYSDTKKYSSGMFLCENVFKELK